MPNDRDDAARELELYITNDGRLYKSMMLPIYKNLATKMTKGEFNLDLGIKAFKYIVDEGAKRYTLEHGSIDKWSVLFPPESRKAVAEGFADFFVAEWRLGQFRDLLPKKYQGFIEPGIDPRTGVRHVGKTNPYQREPYQRESQEKREVELSSAIARRASAASASAPATAA